MANLPYARTTTSDTAGAVANGADLICIVAPTPSNADAAPRVFGSASAVYELHGYSEGTEYAAFHITETKKPVMFVGIPIVTAGEIGRLNTSGNTGTSVVTIAAGVAGVLTEHDGILRVKRGGTVGTDQIVLELSLDGGKVFKPVRMGTANSYTFPLVGASAAFAAGTLVTGDVVATWHGTGPRGDADGLAVARTELAKQYKGFRTTLMCGDLQNSTEAAAYRDFLNAYKTENDRAIQGRGSIKDRAPLASMSHVSARMTGSPTLTFAEVGATGDTITRSAGSWVTDGFAVGDTVTIGGSVSNNVTGVIAALTATVITFDATDLVAEGPVAGCTAVATPTLTFAEVGATGDTITRNRGSWLTDGFRVGDLLTVTGTSSNNFAAAAVTGVTANVLTLGSQDLVAEVVGTTNVSATAGQTKAAWMAASEAAFATIDGARRIDMSAGRGTKLSPFSGWHFRRPAAWAASLREYQHDLHIPTWRKKDGPTGWDLTDASGRPVEWDDRVDGGAACAARFTSFRTWSNEGGAYIALSLTRASDASLLVHMHNANVVNLAENVCQASTENAAVGYVGQLNADGTMTAEALSTVRAQVESDLENALLQNRGEGARVSSVKWTPSATDVYNVAEPVMTGVLEILLNGTVHSVDTRAVIKSGGQ